MFVAAGINLNSSKARDFGQRILPHKGDTIAANALLFGDFLNYWIVDDYCAALKPYATTPPREFVGTSRWMRSVLAWISSPRRW